LYFSGNSDLFSYNSDLMRVSSALRDTSDTVEPWWQGRVEEKNNGVATVAELSLFLKNPQKYFVRNVLGVYPGSQENITDEHEPFVLDTLQKYLVEQDMVQTGGRKKRSAITTTANPGSRPMASGDTG